MYVQNSPVLYSLAGLFHYLDSKFEGIEGSFEERHALLGGGQTTMR